MPGHHSITEAAINTNLCHLSPARYRNAADLINKETNYIAFYLYLMEKWVSSFKHGSHHSGLPGLREGHRCKKALQLPLSRPGQRLQGGPRASIPGLSEATSDILTGVPNNIKDVSRNMSL